jgi:hypothetical protein
VAVGSGGGTGVSVGTGVAVGSGGAVEGGGGDWNREKALATSFPPPKSNAKRRETNIKGTSGDSDLILSHSAKMLQSLCIIN